MRRKTGKRVDEHYASFSRRSWAATFDSLLILLIISPLFELLFIQVYPFPELKMDDVEFQQRLAMQTTGTQTIAFLSRHFYETGLLARWLVDTGLQIVLLCGLTAFCWRRWSATPGKMLVRIRVADAKTEQPLSNRQILLRLLGYFVSSVPLLFGFFWASFDRRRQGWHDKIADTVVVRVPKSNSEAAHP